MLKGSGDVSQVVFRGSKDRLVDKTENMGPIESPIIQCYVTLSLLPGVPGHISRDIKGSLSRTFVVSGPSLLFYRSWKVPNIAGFSDGVMH